MDQGIIRAFKAYYRRSIIQQIIQALENSSDDGVKSIAKKISLLDAMHNVKVAWNEITTDCVVNCFRKAGFCEALFCSEEINDILIANAPHGLALEEWETYIAMDDEEQCNGNVSDTEICITAQSSSCQAIQIQEDRQPPSAKEVLDALGTLRRLYESCANADYEPFYSLDRDVKKLLSTNLTQKKITDFFYKI